LTNQDIRTIFGAGILSAAVAIGAWSNAPALACGVQSKPAAHAQVQAQASDTAFLVVAPDRGFLGNAQVQDAYEAFAKGRSGGLVFTTGDRTRQQVENAVRSLEKAGAKRIVVLPFFVSASDPGFERVRTILQDGATHVRSTIAWSRPFGESYYAVEMLADRFRSLHDPAGRRVLVVGTGATDADHQQAAQGFGFEAVRVLVNVPQSKLSEEIGNALKGGRDPVVVPFHLGQKLDSMMSFDAALASMLPQGAELIEGDLASHPALPLWLEREANRAMPIRPAETGVVLLAHGSNYDWNETMLGAVRPLEKRYMIEPALSMADPIVIERAIRRLERRGAKRIVIVRVFGLSSSFQQDVERMIGADVEQPSHEASHAEHGGSSHASHGNMHAMHGGAHGGHGGHHGASMVPSRIRTSALLTTLGGLDDHRLFAEALLDRANALSKNPNKETVILVAHGAEDDGANAQWQRNLESLAKTMRSGSKYQAIRVATWREDWPDKREAGIKTIRTYVQDAATNGGRAIVIPARTNDRGPEQQLLKGLTYELGTGFAPHPKFAQWFEEQIQAGIAAFQGETGTPRHHSH
jgi:sirohydrochlorin ferrochelatase